MLAVVLFGIKCNWMSGKKLLLVLIIWYFEVVYSVLKFQIFLKVLWCERMVIMSDLEDLASLSWVHLQEWEKQRCMSSNTAVSSHHCFVPPMNHPSSCSQKREYVYLTLCHNSFLYFVLLIWGWVVQSWIKVIITRQHKALLWFIPWQWTSSPRKEHHFRDLDINLTQFSIRSEGLLLQHLSNAVEQTPEQDDMICCPRKPCHHQDAESWINLSYCSWSRSN